MLNVAIVEDDSHCAEQLEEYLRKFGIEQRLRLEIRRFSDGAALVNAYDHTFDLLLLDVNMPGMDGISAARQIRALDSDVLLMFITNLAQYAIKGYEVDALDYMLKPVSYGTLSMKLKKALRVWRGRDNRAVFVRQEGERVRLPISRIYYVEVSSHSLCYHTADGDITPTGGQTMRQVERELAQYRFVRCHNCYLINLRFVDGLSGSTVQVAGNVLPVSRSRRKDLLDALLRETTGGDR